MALTHGMNIAAVRTSMKKIESFAGQLDGLKNQINSEMNNLLAIWSGPDAQRFVSSDWGYYKGNMDVLIGALRSLSANGLRQATEQETVSKA